MKSGEIYSFQCQEFRDGEMIRNHTKTVSMGDFVTWQEVLTEMTSFLSGVYGYDIGEQVKYDNGFGDYHHGGSNEFMFGEEENSSLFDLGAK